MGVGEPSFCGVHCRLALMTWLMGFAGVACRIIQVMINSKQTMRNQTKGDGKADCIANTLTQKKYTSF